MNLAVQRDQVDRAYEDTEMIEDNCLEVASKIWSSSRAEPGSRELAQSAVESVMQSRAEEETPDQSVVFQLKQMSVTVAEPEIAAAEGRSEQKESEVVEEQHQEQREQQPQEGDSGRLPATPIPTFRGAAMDVSVSPSPDEEMPEAQGPPVQRRPAAADPLVEERAEEEPPRPAEEEPSAEIGEDDFVPDWGNEELFTYMSERPCLLKAARGELKQLGLSPNHQILPEQLHDYQEGFHTDETVQTRPGALPESQKVRQMKALEVRAKLEEELYRIKGDARDDESSDSDLTDQGEEEERVLDKQLAETVPLFQTATQQLEEDRMKAVGKREVLIAQKHQARLK